MILMLGWMAFTYAEMPAISPPPPTGTKMADTAAGSCTCGFTSQDVGTCQTLRLTNSREGDQAVSCRVTLSAKDTENLNPTWRRISWPTVPWPAMVYGSSYGAMNTRPSPRDLSYNGTSLRLR